MIFRTAFSLLLIASPVVGCYAQYRPSGTDNQGTFRLDQHDVRQARAQEQARGAIEQEPKSFYMMQSRYELDPTPVVFQRQPEGFEPTPTVKYFYSLPDSTVRVVTYEWDRDASADLEEPEPEPTERLGEYNAQYEKLRAELVRELGDPEAAQELREQRGSSGLYWSRSDEWRTNDHEVSMELAFSSEKDEDADLSIKSISTHQIRVKVSWLSDARRARPEVRPIN